MQSFRFSPIQDEAQMLRVLQYIHSTCHTLCKQSLGNYLSVAGNIGIFCHYDEEFSFLEKLQTEITDVSKNVYGKYFRLHKPIVIPKKNDIPEATYSYLYIRKPDAAKPQVGDLDFYIESEKYTVLKQSLVGGKSRKGIRVLPNRPDLDLIELSDPRVDAFGFIGDKKWQSWEN